MTLNRWSTLHPGCFCKSSWAQESIFGGGKRPPPAEDVDAAAAADNAPPVRSSNFRRFPGRWPLEDERQALATTGVFIATTSYPTSWKQK